MKTMLGFKWTLPPWSQNIISHISLQEEDGALTTLLIPFSDRIDWWHLEQQNEFMESRNSSHSRFYNQEKRKNLQEEDSIDARILIFWENVVSPSFHLILTFVDGTVLPTAFPWISTEDIATSGLFVRRRWARFVAGLNWTIQSRCTCWTTEEEATSVSQRLGQISGNRLWRRIINSPFESIIHEHSFGLIKP